MPTDPEVIIAAKVVTAVVLPVNGYMSYRPIFDEHRNMGRNFPVNF